MRSTLKAMLAVGMICSLAFSSPVFANVPGEKTVSQNKLEICSRVEANGINSDRGNYISVSNCGITNVGGGVIGISGFTTAHESVDKIRIHLYLDRLNENENWVQVDHFDFTFLPEDVPDGDLSEATVSFDVTDQPSGYYYRVRGTHGVWKNGVVETQSTWTNGVMITDTP